MLREPVLDLHDTLEEAYLAHMAAGGGRWFCARRRGYVLTGFAGLDAPTTSRVSLVDVNRPDVARVLDEAEAFFTDRRTPWSVAVTPGTRPGTLADELQRRGFHVAARFGIHTLDRKRAVRPLPAGVHLRPVGPRDAGLLTRLTIDGFGMPARYLPALRDIAEGWLRNGAHAYVAEIGGEPVGTAMAVLAGGVVGVYNVSVVPRARRRGVARALMEQLLRDVDDRRIVTLQVARRSAAERLYEEIGFERRYDWELWTSYP